MTERLTRWTAVTALSLASLALGVSLWGCEQSRARAEEPAAAHVQEVQVQAPAAPAGTVAASPAPVEPKAAVVPAGVTQKQIQASPIEPASASDLRVKRLVVTQAVENREPLPATTFVAGQGKVMAFVELSSQSDADGRIIVSFEHESGTKVGLVELKVPANSARWRTWAQTQLIKQPGHWEAVVRTPDGAELSRAAFEVES